MEFIIDIAIWLITRPFQAMAGILYPARSKVEKAWQIAAAVLLVGGFGLFETTFLLARVDVPLRPRVICFLAGTALLVVAGAIGASIERWQK
jgi:hypothetical protein